MTHSAMLTMAAFKGWLQDTQTECAPLDGERCVLAEWLKTEGFPDVSVDGEQILLNGGDANEADEDDILMPDKWMHEVITAFDAMAPGPRLMHCLPYATVPVETYRQPILTLLDSILQAEKGVAQAQASIEQMSLNAAKETP